MRILTNRELRPPASAKRRLCSRVFTRGGNLAQVGVPIAVVVLCLAIVGLAPCSKAAEEAARPPVIPPGQIGSTVEQQYSGDGLSVCATDSGARLRCVFQRIEGEATREGLWLTSTADNAGAERFRVMATKVWRAAPRAPFAANDPLTPTLSPNGGEGVPGTGEEVLPPTGTVSVEGKTARFIRPGLTEEYRVSADGVRQDFIIAQRPNGQGELRVDLDVTGAIVEPLANGARLVLAGSGRKLNYHRLRVTDATGRELAARMEIPSPHRGRGPG